MLDSALKYLSVIAVAGAAISFIVTTAGAVISFTVGLIKYLDQRNREERTKRFELFHNLMARISNKGEQPNEGLALTEQAAAIYELQHFKDYAYASLPILDELRKHFEKGKVNPLLLKAIDDTVNALK